MESILITGGNGGIGLACASVFLERRPDCKIFLGCRSARAGAETLAEQSNGRVEILSLEVTDPAAWESSVATIVERCGSIDVLINNAGHHRDSLLATMPLEAWHEVIASNLTGTFLGCRAVTRPMMAARRGHIINIASLSALLAPAGQTNYAAAKAGVVALTQSLAKEVARAGITVNAICPGYIDTGAFDAAATKEMAAKVPARRLGQAREVAELCEFLASGRAPYLTGSVIKIDGGIF
ncbi:MAG: SDR family oxidoreductase [Verrucomicrobiales bacterium]